MAADILLYDANLVPTGIDQKQHVELARDLATRFNNKYGETFVNPEPLIPEIGAKIMDLQNPTKKMSKSSEETKGLIFLLDSEKDIRKKIMAAVTDSDNKVYYDPKNKPGISNLLTIYSALSDLEIKQVEEKFKDYNYGNLKKEVADLVVDKLLTIQKKYHEYMNSGIIDEILDNGAQRVQNLAQKKYKEVLHKVGLGRD